MPDILMRLRAGCDWVSCVEPGGHFERLEACNQYISEEGKQYLKCLSGSSNDSDDLQVALCTPESTSTDDMVRKAKQGSSSGSADLGFNVKNIHLHYLGWWPDTLRKVNQVQKPVSSEQTALLRCLNPVSCSELVFIIWLSAGKCTQWRC